MISVLTAALLAGGLHAAQIPRRAPLTAQTRPLSPSVLATIVTRDQTLELVVLWRGTPGWFLSGSGRGAKYSEGNGTFTGALDYGGLHLELSYEQGRRRVQVQGVAVSLPETANVILVDRVGRDGFPAVAGLVTVNSHIDGNPTWGSLLGVSPEIVSFLECDARTANDDANRTLVGYVCADLKK